MFEFEDSRLGKIKVISVTEARTAIATIMTDKSFNYVITKNNRPIRVIINYDTYRMHMAPLSPGKGLSKPKGSIKGLIETRDKELKDQVSRLESPPQEMRKAVGEESIEAPPPEAAAPPLVMEPMERMESMEEPVPVPEMGAEPVPEPEVEPDYFGARANPEQSDYFARFRKLYESAPRPKYTPAAAETFRPPPPVEPAETQRGPLGALPEPPAEIESPLPEKRDRGRPEPPSIQDLLRELENTKLSGEE